MEQKVDYLIQAAHALGAKEVLVPVSSDTFLEVTQSIQPGYAVRGNGSTKAISGIGGNVFSLMKNGITVHFKIDSDLKNASTPSVETSHSSHD